VKNHSLALALFATSLTAAACTDMDMDDPEGAMLDETSQEIVEAIGCDVFMDLSDIGTSRTWNVSGDRYRAYSCENINFYIRTAGHSWNMVTKWAGEYDLSDCQNNWLRTRLERTSGTYTDSGTITAYAKPYQYTGTLNGHEAILTKCSHPTNGRTMYSGREYKYSVKSWGGAYAFPHNGRDQDFSITLSR
jgi:hypothetical protein